MVKLCELITFLFVNACIRPLLGFFSRLICFMDSLNNVFPEISSNLFAFLVSAVTVRAVPQGAFSGRAVRSSLLLDNLTI